MRNIIKTSNFISVTLDDGNVLVTSDTSAEMFQSLLNAADDDERIDLVDVDYFKDKETKAPSKTLKEVFSGEKESEYIVFKGNHAYIPSVSELTVPQDFVEAILSAEQEGNRELLQTYINFWTLISMNPDSRVRDNVFWFIRKWDIKISKSGFLIAYRNADFKQGSSAYTKEWIERVTNDYIKIKAQKKSPNNYTYKGDKLYKLAEGERDTCTTLAEWYIKVTDKEDTITFTDHHSHTFTIRLGEPVSMPREECCSDHNVSCSTGLHAGSAGWLERNYFGDTGLMVLINPADITSIPKLMGIIAVML